MTGAAPGGGSSRDWYRIERVRRPDDLDGGTRAQLHEELADVYAAAHGAPQARSHFLLHRSLAEFDDVYLARSREGVALAWLASSTREVDGSTVVTVDDAVVDPRFHHRGLTRAIFLRLFRRLATDALRRPLTLALLTTNPIVAIAAETHLRPGARRYPQLTGPGRAPDDLASLAVAVAAALHPEAPFDPDHGVLRDFLPTWHLASAPCDDELLQRYFDRHLRPGSAVLLLVPIDRRMIAAHVATMIRKSAQTAFERRSPPAGRAGGAAEAGPRC